MPNQHLPDFHVEGVLAETAQSTVYRAYNRTLDTVVALKRWRDPVSEDERRQFLSECQMHYRMSEHPNVVRLLWAGVPPEGRPWLATELFDTSLQQRLPATPPLTPDEAYGIADDLLAGLAALHAAGHVHRDVKPANVLLKDGRAALADLGIAIHITGEAHHPEAGTGGFIAPELGSGAKPDFRSDVYSAGITLDLLLRDIDRSPEVEKVLDSATSYHAADRPVDASDLRTRLRQALGMSPAAIEPAMPVPGKAPHRARRLRVAAAATIVALAGFGVALAASQGQDGSLRRPTAQAATPPTTTGDGSVAALRARPTASVTPSHPTPVQTTHRPAAVPCCGSGMRAATTSTKRPTAKPVMTRVMSTPVMTTPVMTTPAMTTPTTAPTSRRETGPPVEPAVVYRGRAVNGAGQPISGLYVYQGDFFAPDNQDPSAATLMGRTSADGDFTIPCPGATPVVLAGMRIGSPPEFGNLSLNYAWRSATGTGGQTPASCQPADSPSAPVVTLMRAGGVLTGRYHWTSGRAISGDNGLGLSIPGACCVAFQGYIVDGEYRFVGLQTGTYDMADMMGRDSIHVVAGEAINRDWYMGTGASPSGWSPPPSPKS